MHEEETRQNQKWQETREKEIRWNQSQQETHEEEEAKEQEVK